MRFSEVQLCYLKLCCLWGGIEMDLPSTKGRVGRLLESASGKQFSRSAVLTPIDQCCLCHTHATIQVQQPSLPTARDQMTSHIAPRESYAV